MKRAIALFLALVFVFGLIPVSALAAEPTLRLYYNLETVTNPTEVKERRVAPGANAEIADGSGNTLTIDTPEVVVQALPETGKTFDHWEIDGTVVAKGATSFVAPHTAVDDIHVVAVYTTTIPTEFSIGGPSGVTVSVEGADSVDASQGVTAKTGDTVRVRLNAGNGTTQRLPGGTEGIRINATDTAATDPAATRIAGSTDPDAQSYVTFAFTMPASNVEISALYEYLVSLTGATIKGATVGTPSATIDNNTFWAMDGEKVKITVTPATGKTISSWTSDAAVEFTDESTTTPKNKTVMEFTMPKKAVNIAVNYETKYTYTVNYELVSPGKTVPAANYPVEYAPGTNVEFNYATVDASKVFTVDGTDYTGYLIGFQVSKSGLLDTENKTTLQSFAMPEENVTLTLVYVQKYKLSAEDATVTLPSGHKNGDPVAVGEEVTIESLPNDYNVRMFDYWQYAPDSSRPANATETISTGDGGKSTTSFDMPVADAEKGLTVTAHYDYVVLLTSDGNAANGTIRGTSSNKAIHSPGDTATIIAAKATDSTKVFTGWTVAAGTVAGFTADDLADKNASTTTFTMPEGVVNLQANYGEAYKLSTTEGALLALRNASTGTREITAADGTLLTAVAAQTYNGRAFKEWKLYDKNVKDFDKEDSYGASVAAANLGVSESALNKSTLDFTMSDEIDGMTLRAFYEGTAYQLKVNDGTGSGYYAEGNNASIVAKDVPGKLFKYWTLVKYFPNGTVTEEVAGSSYTFKMPACYVVATPMYEQLYSIMLTNNSDYMKTAADGALSISRAVKTVNGVKIPEKAVASQTGDTAIADYFSVGDVLTITTPGNETGAEFTGWYIVSGSGKFEDASKPTTTFVVAAANTVIAARYGGNMLVYKEAERVLIDEEENGLPTYRYDNWTYSDVPAGKIVAITAYDPDGTFKHWASEPDDLISDKTNKQISFTMPNGTVKVWPEYTHHLKLTDAEYSLDGGTTWTLGGGEDVPIAITSGETVMLRPVEGLIGAAGSGNRVFKSWRTNSTRIGSQGTTKVITFTMPPEDVEFSVNYNSYTLTVIRSVGGTAEYYSLLPGEYITLVSDKASGGRQFLDWSASAGLVFTVNDEEWASDDKNDSTKKDRLLSQEITVQMPAKDAFITANFSQYGAADYWNTDARIRMIGEPKRYYAALEYFQPYDMSIVYYADLESPGVEVDPKDYVIQIVKAGTYEVATTSDLCFTQTGAFDMLITMYINGVQMAETIRVMDEPSTHLYCTAQRAEFVKCFTKPRTTIYYEGESVEKDGMDVQLLSVDHVSGVVRYSTVRELDESEYKLKPWGTAWDADNSNASTKLPTIAEIQAKIAAGAPGYKFADGDYQVRMEITDCYDYTQLNSNGSYMKMEYIVNDDTDYIWVRVRAGVPDVELKPEYGANNDKINNVAGTVHPHTSWEITQSESLGERYLTISSDGWTGSADELAKALEVINGDPNVAYLVATSNKLRYKIVIKAPGVTKITVRARGDMETAVQATCEITVRSGNEPVPMTGFGLNGHVGGLNKSVANLYVGNKLSLYPTEFSPSDADKTCNYFPVFTDGLLPQNAEYYVSVSAAGVVEVLKYTDRQVRIYAVPIYPLGVNDYKNGNTIWSFCDINVLQIPVDNLTMYPAAMTLYRLASKGLKVTLYPEAASNKNIRWTSTDSSVASVDNQGNVTANKLGTATITATSESNPEIYQTCTVTVAESVLLTGLMLNKTSAMLGIDDTMILTPYFTPSTATTQSVTWTSSDPMIATVSATGKVRGIAEGAVVITATANDGTGKQASCVISVSTIVSSAVVLNKQTLALIEDESETLVATVYPTNVSNAKVNWKSSNENVATVDPDGVVTATGGGSAIITATAKDSSTKYADCVVAVTPKIPVTSITLNLGDFDILLNDTTVLTPTIAPSNATYKATWTSSDASVASVDEKGKISALKTGSAVITCKAGDMTKAITVSVVTKTFSTGKVVNCARRVNVRANSSGGSTIVGFAYLGDVYKVLDKVGNWYKIQYNAGTVAYIWSRYLSASETGAGYVSAGKVGSTTTTDTTGTATPAPVVTAKTLTITNCTYCVNVRSGAGTTFSRLGYAYLDETFTYTGTQGDWYIITYNGVTGYVSSQFVKVNG